MKILLLGHKGYLGSFLAKHLKVDILDLSERKLFPNGKKYDYVINCIGKPNLEYCEKQVEETNYSNWFILRDIKRFYPSSKIINFSSYYVYDDTGLCTEKSRTTDKYNYTRQKLLGEKEVENGVSFRIGKLFGNPQATQKKLTEYILDEDDLVLDTVLFNPTSVIQVLKVIMYELDHKNLKGVYNLSNNGIASHYDYGVFINNILKSNKNIKKIKKIVRSFNNYGRFTMSVEKINRKIHLTPWEEDMKLYLMNILTS